MKHYLRFFILVFVYCFFCLTPIADIYAQSDTAYWKWARTPSDTGPFIQEGGFIATDHNDNVFITGTFANLMRFDTTILAGISGGGLNVFIAKYSPSGQVLWARDASSASQTRITPTGIATDQKGNVFVTGFFQYGTLSFNGITLPGTPSAYENLFIVKYDSSGNFLWAKDGGQTQSQSSGIATDNMGNAYISGWFKNDSFPLGNTTLYSVWGIYQEAFFTAKYNPQGNVIWAKGASDDTYNFGLTIASDRYENIYVSGDFLADSIRFGNQTIYSQDTAISDLHPFTLKYDSAGSLIWAKEGIGGAVSCDKNGNIYVIQGFNGDSLTIGTITLYNIIPNYGTYFIAKYDSLGTIRWAKKIGSGKYILPFSIAANDVNGLIYITGSWSGLVDSIVFDSTVLHLPPRSTDPMFILAYDISGNVLCGAALASGGDDQNSVCTDIEGNAFITGDFILTGDSAFVIGADTFFWGPDAFVTNGSEKVFTAKFNCNQKTETGIGQITSNTFLSLYPDPVSTLATVKYILPDDTKENTLIIYDVLGNRLNEFHLDTSSGEININCQGLSRGIYFYSLVSDGKTILSRKMVVEQ